MDHSNENGNGQNYGPEDSPKKSFSSVVDLTISQSYAENNHEHDGPQTTRGVDDVDAGRIVKIAESHAHSDSLKTNQQSRPPRPTLLARSEAKTGPSLKNPQHG